MTPEEAIERLKDYIDTYEVCGQYATTSITEGDVEVFNTAIKALEQQPCEDCISRIAQDAVRECQKVRNRYGRYRIGN